MNNSAYDKLSDVGKAAVDANTGMKWALIAGQGFDASDDRGYPQVLESGTIHQIPEAERAEWEAAAERAKELYFTELEDKGLPGRETYAAIQGFVSECEAL